MTEATVRTTDGPGGVRRLTLDRPPANAIDEHLLHDLDAAVATAEEDPAVRSIVLTGTGRFFSGGFDFFSERRSGDLGLEMVDAYNRAHRRLFGCPKPTVAAVAGHAVAGGLVLALACDHVVVADSDLKVGLTEVAVGAGFPRSAAEIVRQRLPAAGAARLVLGAELWGPTVLVELGVTTALVPIDAVLPTATDLAARLGTHSSASYAHAKHTLVADAIARIDAETWEEAAAGLAVWTSAESRAARNAMRERLAGG